MTNDTGPYKVQVLADQSGKFCGNALRFLTIQAAQEYAKDLARRWTLVQQWRVINADENNKIVSGPVIVRENF